MSRRRRHYPLTRIQFRWRLTATIAVDYVGAWLIEIIFKRLFGDTSPRGMVVDGLERREKRRAAERAALEAVGGEKTVAAPASAAVKKTQ